MSVQSIYNRGEITNGGFIRFIFLLTVAFVKLGVNMLYLVAFPIYSMRVELCHWMIKKPSPIYK